ncbi:acetyltransferase [Corynebacterium sp. BCW_4722]|nr:acetyltransferase [Corynebacterium sp. BCW_4722]
MAAQQAQAAETARAGQPATGVSAGGATKGSTAYRVDLDGLRGFAIALVVLFHVFVGRVSGGVDVFLLLSGYFFLGGQLRYAMRPNPNLNPWWPLWRTIRRLVPALALVLVATLVAVITLTPALMSDELARQFKASILYRQNWELAAQNLDYAAAGQDTSPLQHLWSMSVQGQFYIVAILFGTLVAIVVSKLKVDPVKARRGTVVVLALITVASFAYAARFGWTGTGENYYSTYSRAWELSLGGLLAFVPSRFFLPKRTAGITALIGVLMIAATGIVITTSLAFPGPLTLLPLTGAALVILSGNSNPVSSVLSSKPMTWLGQVAYSLYLWHWPILIIISVIAGYDTPPVAVGIVVIAVSLALAHVTHVLVEDPLRQHRRRPLAGEHPFADAAATLRTAPGVLRAIGGVLVAALVAVLLAVVPVWNQRVAAAEKPLDPEEYPGAMALLGANVPNVEARPDPNLIAGIYPPVGHDGCMRFKPDATDDLVPEHCVYGDPDAETTLVLTGGSHIEPYMIPLDVLGRQHNFKIIPYIRQACPLVAGGPENPVNDIVDPVCAEWSANALERIIELDPDMVISTSTRPEGRPGEGSATLDQVPEAYANLWAVLAQNGIPFVGLRDNPWIFDALGNPVNPNYCIVDGNSEADCSVPASQFYTPEDPAAAYLDPSWQQWEVDTEPWFCPDGICPPQIGNVYIYRDQNHISNAYALTLAPLLWEALEPIFEALELPYADTNDEDMVTALREGMEQVQDEENAVAEREAREAESSASEAPEE